MLNGGYVMVSKTDTDLYKKLNNALNLGKPVLFYEDANTCYYIDTIAKSGDDIVLTKGGKTFTITDANVVTESGDIQTKYYQYNCEVVDKDNNDYYFTFISTNPNYTKFSEIIKAIGSSAYVLKGFVCGSDKTTMTIITNSNFTELNTDFDIFSMYDDEGIGSSFNIDTDIDLVRSDLFTY